MVQSKQRQVSDQVSVQYFFTLTIFIRKLNMETKRVRNFTRNEEIIIMEEVQRRQGVLLAAFSGPGGGRKRKAEAWEAVTAALNSQTDSGCQRSVQQVKKKYENIKTEAKSKAGECKRPPTGGGPPCPEPTVAENIFLDMMGDAPSVTGVSGGFESGVIDISFISDSGDVPSVSLPELKAPSLFPPPSAEKVRKPRSDKVAADLHIEVLQLEKQRIEAELALAQVRLQNENVEHELRKQLLKKQLQNYM